MLPGDHLPADGTEEQSNLTKGSGSLKSAQEILPARDPVSRGNTIPTDLISTQPLPAAAPPAAASQEPAEFKKPQCDLQKPTCPRCGLAVPDHRLPPVSLQGSSSSVHSSRSSRRSRSRSNVAGSHQNTASPAAQPLPAAAPPAAASQEPAEFKKPQCDLQKPTCPRCGLAVPDHRLPPVSLQGSSSSVHSSRSSRRSRSRSNVAGSHQNTASPADSCVQLLLACLWCQGSVLLLGLLEVCSSCLHTLCSSCCHACARCCAAIQEAPVEELNCNAHCHSVLFESCCEPTECLEFCLECCDICHRS